ncbi:OmpH family outer membrane protein [Tenacibaculum maritimum]|uniref:OmpH family outer membrane protein n=1 Tax=Tenacibaculum maritimum TaxID=107401 RepID=UPI001E351CD8|nr:OmpH family outer membrane protein [Tenacibaculum maritimum]MCD9610965.1 OmpH family outer membrane protein [Tenacibaculum maritimum]
MKFKNVWNLVNSILVCCLIVGFIYSEKEEGDKVVYVDNIKIFKEFNMTKELGKANEERYRPELKRFDSLVKEITELETLLKGKKKISKKDKEEYQELRKEVLLQEKELQDIKMSVKDHINKKVWERLNMYIKEYGKKENVELILGAQGQGNIMYGDSIRDITEEVIEFSNYKYEGN